MTGELVKDLVCIEITRLPITGMLLGVCQTLDDLLVHGREVAEMEERILSAIKAILQSKGFVNVLVSRIADDGTDYTSAVLTILKYRVEYRREALLH